MRHTQGQWHAVEYAGVWVIQKSKEYEIKDNLLDAEIIGEEQAEANAKLIAAAPDLLEALQDMLSRFLHADEGMIKADHVKYKAIEAIKKATK